MKFLLAIVLCIEWSLLLAQRGTLPALIPYRRGNKWGYCDSNKKILIEPQWKSVEFFQGTKARIINDDNSYSLIDTDGKYIIPSSLHWTGVYSNEDSSALNCYNEAGMWGMVDMNGVLNIPCLYERRAYEKNRLQYSGDHSRYLVVIKNGKYGVVDQYNNILVPFIYDKLSQPYHELEENEQLQAVRNGKRGIIDLHNHITAPFRYWDVRIAWRDNEDYYSNDSIFQVWKSVRDEKEQIMHWKYKNLNRWWMATGKWKEGYTTPLYERINLGGMHCGGGRTGSTTYLHKISDTIDNVVYTYTGVAKLMREYSEEEHFYNIMKSEQGAYAVYMSGRFIIKPQFTYQIISGNIPLNMFVVVKDGRYGVIDSAMNVLIPLQQRPLWQLNKVKGKYYARSSHDNNAIINDCGEVVSVFKERNIKSNYPVSLYYQPTGKHHVYIVKDNKTECIGIVSTNDSTWYPAISFKYRILERVSEGLFMARDAIGDTTHTSVFIDANNHEPFPGLIPYVSWDTRSDEKYELKREGLTKIYYSLGKMGTDQKFFYVSESGKIYADDLQFPNK